MQGPIPPSSPRRAGDSSGMPGSPEGELKDWQKNTWFGPAPPSGNPFDEPDESPELLELRSKNVSEHTGSFWNEEPTGYQYSAGQLKTAEKAARVRPKRNGLISVRTVLTLAGLLITAVLVLYFGVFRIREIRVEGNTLFPDSEIIRLSGIRKGESILRLSESKTENSLTTAAASEAQRTENYNYYRVQFRYLEKEFPGTVTIAVREREACCIVTWCGIWYVLDKNGMVLYESEDTGLRERADLLEVKGLDIRSGARAGQTIVLASAAQEQAFRDLFTEMKVLGISGKIQILEADLSNPSSMLLTSRDRFTISLGNSEGLHAKLRSMTLVYQKLLEMGRQGGSINVSNPETPSYSPAVPR